jgi:hypothetical protein
MSKKIKIWKEQMKEKLLKEEEQENSKDLDLLIECILMQEKK